MFPNLDNSNNLYKNLLKNRNNSLNFSDSNKNNNKNTDLFEKNPTNLYKNYLDGSKEKNNDKNDINKNINNLGEKSIYSWDKPYNKNKYTSTGVNTNKEDIKKNNSIFKDYYSRDNYNIPSVNSNFKSIFKKDKNQPNQENKNENYNRRSILDKNIEENNQEEENKDLENKNQRENYNNREKNQENNEENKVKTYNYRNYYSDDNITNRRTRTYLSNIKKETNDLNLNKNTNNMNDKNKNIYDEIRLKEEKNRLLILENEEKREKERREKYLEDLKQENENNKLVTTLDFYYKKKQEEEVLKKTDALFKILFPEFSEILEPKDKQTNTDNRLSNSLGLFPERSLIYDPLFDKERRSSEDPDYLSPLYKIKEEEPEIEKEHIIINEEINNIQDLIDLCDKYPLSKFREYNINMVGIHNVKDSLIDLKNLIGLNSLKENIVDQILYFVQDLHNTSEGDYMHTVIYGPPGTGKTEVAKIMGNIYSKLGILKKNVFKKVTRDDLVAGYLGQTSMKTKDVINECLGGVLFIDEAYALGNAEKKDSFAKESIDTLCEALSNHKKNLMCIIAGYEDELKKCFFSFNEGLDSRFTWRFKIDDYNPSELKEIFIKKVKDNNWEIIEEIDDEWFKKNMDNFKYFGRDIETLLAKVKIAHGRRVFCRPEDEKRKITKKDIEKGLDMYLKNDNIKNRKDKKEMERLIRNTMYL